MAHNMAPVEDMPMCSHLTNDTEVSLERNNESSMSKELDCRSVRRVYLITYSRADLVKFPTRRSFAHAVLASFSGVPASIQQWCCSQEEHQSSTGKHYHMAIKFDKNQRWLSSKRYLLKTMVYRSTFLQSIMIIIVLGNMQQKKIKKIKMLSRVTITLTLQTIQNPPGPLRHLKSEVREQRLER